MKHMLSICTILVILASASAYAGEIMSLAQQQKTVNEIAQEVSQELSDIGHDCITSSFELYGQKEFSKFFTTENQYSEEQLSLKQTLQIKQCLQSSICELYRISISSEFQSGYGIDAHWVLIYTDSQFTKVISKNLYNE